MRLDSRFTGPELKPHTHGYEHVTRTGKTPCINKVFFARCARNTIPAQK